MCGVLMVLLCHVSLHHCTSLLRKVGVRMFESVVIKYMHTYFISIVKKKKKLIKKGKRRYSSRSDECMAAHTLCASIRL